MNSKSYYIYISSKNRNSSEKIYDFNVLLNNPIITNRNQGINISVVSFSMLNTDYNLKGVYFDYSQIGQTTVIYRVNIPDGNYSYSSLMEYLNSVLAGKIKVEYLKHRNAFKFTNIDYLNYDFIINPQNASNFLGLYQNLELNDNGGISTTSKEGSYINLTNYSHIIIKSNSILFEDNHEDNINNKEMGNSSILFMIDKQDIPPFQLISYRNYDKNDNYSYNISNRQIKSIDLHLYNEKGELLTNTDDYFITLKVVIFNKETIDPNISFLEDIRFLLMNLMFNRKKILS